MNKQHSDGDGSILLESNVHVPLTYIRYCGNSIHNKLHDSFKTPKFQETVGLGLASDMMDLAAQPRLNEAAKILDSLDSIKIVSYKPFQTSQSLLCSNKQILEFRIPTPYATAVASSRR